MKHLVNALSIGALSLGLTACSTTASPVSPSLSAGLSEATDASVLAKPPYSDAAKPGALTIVGIVLQDDGQFDVLQAAVVRAGLVDALNGTTQYTVFAPTDAAFVSTLGVANEAAAIAAVNGLPLDALTGILQYHVINGRRNSRSVLAAPSYETIGGVTLPRQQLTDTGFVAVDVSASNGIVHIIKGVLIPASN